MPNTLHKNLTGADAVHPAAFVQPTDPGSVGANLIWIDTSSGPPYTLKLRNAANNAWLLFSAGITGATGATGATGSTGAPGTISATVTGAPPYICIQDRKTAGTDGGVFTSGADQKRVLNTIIANDLGLATLNTTLNQITLLAGTYRTIIRCPAHDVDQTVAWLYNVTGAGDLLRGTSDFSPSAGNTNCTATISGRFALRSTSVLEVRHRCVTTKSPDGFGVNVGAHFTVPYEVYTVAEFWLEAPAPPFFGSTIGQEIPNTDSLAQRRMVSLYDIPLPGGNG